MNEHTIAGIGISTAELLILIRNCDGRRIIFRYSTIPIIDRLQEILKVPVSIDNDVNCARLEKSGMVV